MAAKLETKWINKEHLELTLEGDFVGFDNEPEKNKFLDELKEKSLKKITINAKKLGLWDSTFLVIFFEAAKRAKQHNFDLDLSSLPEGVRRMTTLAMEVDRKPNRQENNSKGLLEYWGEMTLNACASFKEGLSFVADAFKSIGRFFTGCAIMRPIDFQFALQDCSYKALGIVALISFMVGLIFGFVGAMQLKLFGAQIYVASLVAIAMVRVMGAVMTGIIMAGRTGASYAATIGTMQVNEEIDALKTMGIAPNDFLLLPRMLALILMMPLLTVFSDILGMAGGAFLGVFMLDLAPQEYWDYSLKALNVRHFMVGIFHGFVFGWVISLCGCYYGIKSGKDADAVGKATTSAVVSSIVWIIVCTAIITIICNWLHI